MAGTIQIKEISSFEKLIFRISRGKVLCYFDPLNFKTKDIDGIEKTLQVYVLVFQGGEYLKEKMTKICDMFNGTNYELPGQG